MRSNLRFKHVMTLTEEGFLCGDDPEEKSKEKVRYRGRPSQRKTHIPQLEQKLKVHHTAVMKALTEAPILINKLRALHWLEDAEGDVKATAENAALKTAISKQKARLESANNADGVRAARRRLDEEDDDGSDAGIRVSGEPADSEYIGGVGSAEDMADTEAEAQAAEEDEGDGEDALAPDEEVANAVAMEEAEEEEKRQKQRKELAKKAAAADKRKIKREGTEEWQLKNSLKQDYDVKRQREFAKEQKEEQKKKKKTTVIVKDDVLEEPDEKHVEPATLHVDSGSSGMDTSDDDDPKIKAEKEEQQKAENERKRKQDAENRYHKLQGLSKIAKMKADLAAAQRPPPSPLPNAPRKVFGILELPKMPTLF